MGDFDDMLDDDIGFEEALAKFQELSARGTLPRDPSRAWRSTRRGGGSRRGGARG
jgi:hypothetical protein